MNTTLLGRGFKFEIVLQRKPAAESFTPNEFSESVEKAISILPKDLQVSEVSIETDVNSAGKDEIEMRTIIYWRPNG